MQGKNNISSQQCPSYFDFCHQEQNPVLQLAWGRKIRSSDFDFHLCPRVSLGCVSDTHVNIVGVGLADYAKGCHLTLFHVYVAGLFVSFFRRERENCVCLDWHCLIELFSIMEIFCFCADPYSSL